MRNSSGNILFLILIAVALFAALSFAVTQSSRSTGSNSVQETATINGSVLNQYAASLRAAIQRMTTNNHPVLDLEFNAPADFADLSSESVGVFHPNGGGVIYERAPSALIDPTSDNPDGEWIFTLNTEVKGIGTESAGSLDGNDLVAFMPGVKKEVCEQIDRRLGIPLSPFPKVDSQYFSADLILDKQTVYMDNDYVMPTDEHVIGENPEDSMLIGKAEGCFWEDEAKNYVFYSVLSER